MTDIVDRLRGNAPSIMAMRDGADEIVRLRRENFALAANQCKAGYSGEAGDHMCRHLDRMRELEAVIEGFHAGCQQIINDNRDEACCGDMQPNEASPNYIEPVCCGRPTDGFERAQDIARAMISNSKASVVEP